MENHASVDTLESAFKEADGEYKFWMDAIELATTEQRGWVKTANEAVEIYRADEKQSFNILHSNVETVAPAMYNSRPIPDVRPRHGDNNDIARSASQIIERALSYQLDEYDFDAVAETACVDAYLAGRGVARVRWKTYITQDPEVGERLTWEEVCCEHVRWRGFRRGPARMWQDVPWIAYELFLSRDELIRLTAPQPTFDQATGQMIPPTEEEIEEARKMALAVPLDVTEQAAEEAPNIEKSVFLRARVWEIWNKTIGKGREILFIAPGYKGILRREPDPLGLAGFFDCPEPLQPLADPDTGRPICPYTIYQTQAEELSTVSTRILKLIKVCKFRGIRASEITELDNLETAEDGEFIPSEGAMAALGGTKGLSESIWVMPIKDLVAVIRELVLQRESIKQTIFELSGIADILRGATDPNETLGAQEIKANWGSLRIRKLQKKVERWCRDFMRIKSEIIANKFSERVLTIVNGAEIQPDVLNALRNDGIRRYLVDVETDSTIRGDLTRVQQNMNGFMAATGSFIATFVPLIEKNMFPPELGVAAATVYSAFTRTFKLGKQVEDVLAQLEKAAMANLEQKKAQQAEQQEEQARRQELQKTSEELAIQGQAEEVRKTAAEASKVEAETETVGQEFIAKSAEAAQKTTESQVKGIQTVMTAEKDRREADQADRESDRKVAESLIGLDEALSRIEKTEAETEAQQVETALIRKTGGKPVGPGFTG